LTQRPTNCLGVPTNLGTLPSRQGAKSALFPAKYKFFYQTITKERTKIVGKEEPKGRREGGVGQNVPPKWARNSKKSGSPRKELSEETNGIDLHDEWEPHVNKTDNHPAGSASSTAKGNLGAWLEKTEIRKKSKTPTRGGLKDSLRPFQSTSPKKPSRSNRRLRTSGYFGSESEGGIVKRGRRLKD